MIPGGAREGVEVDGVAGVVRVADDVYARVFHRADEGGGVFLGAARVDADVVEARDGVVEVPETLGGEVGGAGVVDDVEFRAHADVDAVGVAADDFEVAEIDFGAGAFHARAVFGDADEGEAAAFRGFDHLAQRAVGVAARDGVGVDVEEVVHGRRILSFFENIVAGGSGLRRTSVRGGRAAGIGRLTSRETLVSNFVSR